MNEWPEETKRLVDVPKANANLNLRGDDVVPDEEVNTHGTVNPQIVNKRAFKKANKEKKLEKAKLNNVNNAQYFGLTMYPKINEPYGLDYKGTDEASLYSGYLSCCGGISRHGCIVCAFCGCGPVVEIHQGFIGLVQAFGRFIRKIGPGLHTYNSCTEQILSVDMRSQTLNIVPQDLITRDNITITVDCYVVYKIIVPELAIYRLENYSEFINYTTMGTIKTIVAGKTLTELLSQEDEIEAEITQIIDKQTDPFGIDVFSIEIQRIRISDALVSALATIALSEKEMEAKIINAKGNFDSARVFREAADELSKNPLSLQLHYFETLKQISSEKNSQITLMPSVLIDAFM